MDNPHGQAPGTIELVTNNPVKMMGDADSFASALGLSIPPRRLYEAWVRAGWGMYKRGQMPVIDESDWSELKELFALDGFSIQNDRARVRDLIPLQRQIYVDKSLQGIAKYTVAGSIAGIEATHLVISSDDHIIDGHHRWLSAMLLEPDAHVPVWRADAVASQIFNEFIAFSDAEQKIRNG